MSNSASRYSRSIKRQSEQELESRDFKDLLAVMNQPARQHYELDIVELDGGLSYE